MTLNVTSTGTPRQGHTKQVLVAAVAVAVVLALLGGIAAWQTRTSGDAAPAATEAAVTTHAVPLVAPRDQPGPTFFIVGSQAQADGMQRGLDDAAAIRDASGAAPLIGHVVWFPSAEAESTFWLAMGELDTMRGGLGLAPDTIVDLRTPAGASGACGTTVEPASC